MGLKKPNCWNKVALTDLYFFSIENPCRRFPIDVRKSPYFQDKNAAQARKTAEAAKIQYFGLTMKYSSPSDHR